MKPKFMRGSVGVSALLALAAIAAAPSEFSAPSRNFLFTYRVTLKDIPAGAQRVRVWIPGAASDPHQTVVLKKIDGPVRLRKTRDAQSGNRVLYGEIHRPAAGPEVFTIEYEVTRKEYSRGDYETLLKAGAGSTATPKDLPRFLAADHLVPIDGRIKELADQNTQGKEGTLEKAHALYDYVFQTVRYDKSGTGWGRGDSLWVCDARHGNCTDFHSLFISLARAEGIPARFEIGFPVPAGNEGVIPGYHCWAEFFVNGLGWVPVDISEAWKDPKKRDYFFGTLDANRVQFSMGRDLTLEPKQNGGPLNYFIYPYVEVDGKPFEGVEKKFSYRELGEASLGVAAPRAEP
jgi:transglutaminase-like putative cysteine protease